MAFSFVPEAELKRIQTGVTEPMAQASVLANLFRINTLYMIAQAGSGHLGSSYSAMDMVTWLQLQVLKDDGVYFSSKGHDAPGLYAILLGLGKLPFEKIHTLRRLHGLPGHPDVVSTPVMVTNTGSLGMGIAKARGMAKARRLNKQPGRFFVLTGDGELQEGQNWESLQPTANYKYGELTVIVDHNKLQSDTWVKDTSDLGDLERKFAAFGWEVARIDGHNLQQFADTLQRFSTITDKPKVIIADTIKGKGVSFMEGTSLGEDELYKFHSGAPSAENYNKALAELVATVNTQLQAANLGEVKLESRDELPRYAPKDPQKLVAAYGDELNKLGSEHNELVALDADLVLDTGLIPFQKVHGERFIECGIAEQDMVSMAGGLALSGKLPVVHSFSCFLSTRPNEQIYNNATEKTKVIYAGSLAGILPAGPGHSHQSVRDISILGSIPSLTLVEPSTEQEARMTIRWAVEQNKFSTYIRLVSIPVEISYQLPANYKLETGRGVELVAGKEVAIITSGPIMTQQAYLAAQQLNATGKSVAVYNLPWLNTVDTTWLRTTFSNFKHVVTLENHYVQFGQGQCVAAAIAQLPGSKPQVTTIGLEDVPACGQNGELLEHYGFNTEALAKRIAALA